MYARHFSHDRKYSPLLFRYFWDNRELPRHADDQHFLSTSVLGMYHCYSKNCSHSHCIYPLFGYFATILSTDIHFHNNYTILYRCRTCLCQNKKGKIFYFNIPLKKFFVFLLFLAGAILCIYCGAIPAAHLWDFSLLPGSLPG